MITIAYGSTNIINVPQSFLTPVAGTLFELDTEAFRLALKDVEDGEVGIVFPRTHQRNAPVTVAGTTFAQTLEILPPYSVEFENGAYSVRLSGSNNNIFDVEGGILVQNTVQVIPANSAGLIINNIGTGLTPAQSILLEEISKILKNKMVTNKTNGTLTIYDDDNNTVLLQANIFEDDAGLIPYQGTGAERRERLTGPQVFAAAFGSEFA
jgi:hypothetical protein